MIAEQDAVRLREMKVRLERLLSYYSEMGERELAFAEQLEARLRWLSEALRGRTGSVAF